MKKRSLFAAVAMLIVSAIVLTSATYAWFAVSDGASVDDISATVSNNKAAITLIPTTNKKTGAVGSNSLSSSDYKDFNTTMDPVSLNIDSGSVSFYKAAYDGLVFTPDTVNACTGNNTATADYINYGFQVQYKNVSAPESAITLTPTLTPAPQNGANPDFGYALVRVKIGSASTWTDYFYRYDASGTNNTYVPLTAVPSTGVEDANDNAIVDNDATEGATSGVTFGTAPSAYANSGTAITLWGTSTSAGTHTADVEVYLWAEGNDGDCTGAVSASTIGMSFEVG